MCGRFTLTLQDYESVAGDLEAALDPHVHNLRLPRFNVSPGDVHGVLVWGAEGRRIIVARWGVKRRDGGLMVNSRAESLMEGRGLHGRPCAVPTDGYYEWSGEGPARYPSWVHRADGGLILLAGVLVHAGPDEPPHFTVITIPAGADLAPLHHRMPATVSSSRLDAWLEAGRARPDPAWIAPGVETGLAIRPVTRHVNRPANDDPACLDPRDGDPTPSTLV